MRTFGKFGIVGVPLLMSLGALLALTSRGPSVPFRQRATASAIEIGPDKTATQHFFMPGCDLPILDVVTNNPAAAGSLRVSLYRDLRDLGQGMALLASDVAGLDAGGGRVRFRLPEVPLIWNERLAVRIASAVPTSLARREDARHHGGRLFVNDFVVPGSLVFTAGQPSALLGHLACIPSDRPWVVASPWTLVIVLAAIGLCAGLILAGPVRWVPSLLGVLMVATLTAWYQAIPIFEPPDEIEHYDYARYVASQGHLPNVLPTRHYEDGWWHYQWIQEPAFYVAGAQVLRAIGAANVAPIAIFNPRTHGNGGTESPVLEHSGPTEPNLRRAVLALRALNGVIGLLTLLSLWFMLKPLHMGPRVAGLACAAFVLVPTSGAQQIAVSNDGLATLWVAVCASLLFVQPGLRARAALAGVAAGAALATKLTTAFLFPMALVYFWFASPSWQTRVRSMGLFGAAALITVAPLWVRNTLTFGDPLALPLKRTLIRLFVPPVSLGLTDAAYYRNLLHGWFISFWATFGSTGVGPPGGSPVWIVYGTATCALVGLLLSGGIAAARRRSDAAVASALASVTAIVLQLIAVTVGNANIVANSARYLYPLAAPALYLFVWTVRWLDEAPRSRFRSHAVVAGRALWLALIAAWFATYLQVVYEFHFGY